MFLTQRYVAEAVPNTRIRHLGDGTIEAVCDDADTGTAYKYRVSGITAQVKKYMLYGRKSGVNTRFYTKKIMRALNRPVGLTIPKTDLCGVNKRDSTFTRFHKFLKTGPSDSEITEFVVSVGFSEKHTPFVLKFCKSVKSVKNATSRKRVWDTMKVPQVLGTSVDAELKALFNGKRLDDLSDIAKNVIRTLKALNIVRMGGGTPVANTFHTRHTKCGTCRRIGEDQGFFTEVDFWGYDERFNQVCVFEFKLLTTDMLTEDTYRRYNFQLWLTSVMFNMTYPQLAHRTKAYIIVYQVADSSLHIFPCAKPQIHEATKRFFPFLRCLCAPMLRDVFGKHLGNPGVPLFPKRAPSKFAEECLARRYYDCFKSEPIVIQ